MKIIVEIGEQIKVLSPYNSEFVRKAKLLLGRWEKPSWVFPLKSGHALYDVMKECYDHEEPALLEVQECQRPLPKSIEITVQKNQINFETDKAVLVKVPNNHFLKGYKFWLPKSLINNEHGNGHFFDFYIPEGMLIMAENKSKHKAEITKQTLRDMYSNQDQEKEDFLYDSYYKEKEPEKIDFDPEEIGVDDSLKR